MNLKKIYVCASAVQKAQYEEFLNNLNTVYETINFEKRNLDEDKSIVLILGGDGSLNYYLNHLKFNYSDTILYIPTGTANDFSRSIPLQEFIPGIDKVKSIFQRNQLISIPIMNCNDRKFVNVASGGMPAEVTSSERNFFKDISGKISYYVSAVEEVFNTRSYKLEYQVDKQDVVNTQTLGFMIAQGLYTGGGIKSSTSFTANFGKQFNFMIMDCDGLREAISGVIEVQKQSPQIDELPLSSHLCQTLQISSDKELPVKLDGEAYQSKKLLFKKSDQKLNFFIY